MKRVITRSGEKKESERQAESKRKRGGKERWRRNVNAECKQDVKTEKDERKKERKYEKRANTRREQEKKTYEKKKR